MRICFLCESHSIHSQRWIQFFVQQGHNVHVISPYPPGPVEIEGAEMHLIERRWPTKRVDKLRTYLGLIGKTRTLVKSIMPDLLNVLFLTDYGFWGALTRFHPFVITPWGSDVLRHPFQKKFWLFCNKFSLKRSDLVFCNSKPMHQALVEKLSVSEKKIIDITWNGIDLTIFHPCDCDNLRQELGLQNKVILLSNRSLEPLYNIDCVLKMFAEFKKQVPESRLLLAGNGSQKDILMNLAEKLEVSSAVEFLGHLSPQRMNQYLNLADLFITIPQSDSCSGSLLEAFACQKTVIASDIAANQAWIENGRNGWLVNPKNGNALTDVCLKAVRQPLDTKAIKKNLETIKAHADYYKNMMSVEIEFINLAEISQDQTTPMRKRLRRRKLSMGNHRRQTHDQL